MSIFAVIKTGGKQYKVSEGDILQVDKLNIGKKKEIEFKEVLLISDDKNKIKIGTPKVSGAKVKAKVLDAEVKGKKIFIVKFKPKKRYKKKIGFRPRYTRVKISEIEI